MKTSSDLPEPRGPEHLLIEQAADMPALSPGLRERVMEGVRRGVIRRKVTDAVRVTLSMLAAGLLVSIVWTFRSRDTADYARDAAARSAADLTPASAPNTDWGPHVSPGTLPLVQPDGPPPQREGPTGGGSEDARPEIQQLNQLIEGLSRRRDNLCALFPLF